MTSKIDWEQYAARTNSEDAAQIALFGFAADNVGKYRELKFMFHVPNGGLRNKREAGKLKAMGVKAGVPDVWLPAPKPYEIDGYKELAYGLAIELKKTKGGVVRDNQIDWLEELSAQGYATRVCKGFIEARDALIEYLEGRWVQR